jgi:hypothetical protein
MTATNPLSDQEQKKLIEQIIELQREFYFENKNKDTERQKKLRELIDRATPLRSI